MNKNSMIFFDIDYTLFDTANFKESGLKEYKLYDEILSALNQLKEKATLAIFSRGELKFQTEKLTQTKLLEFFPQDLRYIYDEKLEFLHILNVEDRTVYLVDDKLSVLQKAKEKNPKIITIWIKREPYVKEMTSVDNFSPDSTIENLNQLIKLVN